MKIVCTKEEYAHILRNCFSTEAFDACRGCLLNGLHEECPGIDKAVEIELTESANGGDING